MTFVLAQVHVCWPQKLALASKYQPVYMNKPKERNLIL